MRIAVAGATGVVGRHVVTELGRRGHDVVPLSRSHGVDVTQFDGLADRLAGADAVIDTLGIATTRRRPATAFFTTTTRNLLEAEGLAGVGRHVLLSIVGIDGSGFGYYRAKVAQEDVARTLDTSTIILRATQFHEFAEQMLERAKVGPVVVVPHMRSATVAAAEVAAALVDLAENPRPGTVEMGGPEKHDMPDLVRRVAEARGVHVRVVAVKVPGAAGRAMTDGSLIPRHPWRTGTQTFSDWLAPGTHL
ncbi:MAG TPA: NAD(P)H-binding protein [Aeromicrobium sp.]|nr:NAD(P)H-binding protein [Aeromicrobium sp.]HKY58147.1 NAD(P)H-binding protein [Aeromicrobium sp.]